MKNPNIKTTVVHSKSKSASKAKTAFSIGDLLWRALHKIGLHHWKFVFTTGLNKYYQCKVCGKRDVASPFQFWGYQPIDFDWLNDN